MDDFQPLVARIDQQLEHHLTLNSAPDELRHAMHYGVFNGGKRVRPVLHYLACQALGVPLNQADIMAAAIELVHAYSLIHDDLPAMDDDDLRRGKPTCHIQFDEATAILAGDALVTLAFSVVSDNTHLSADIRIQLVTELARAAGSAGMIAGQVLDLAAEDKTISLPELEAIHQRKTGDMISLALESAAIIAGADADTTAALTTYGRKLGLAFQVQDDILDVVGETHQLGKQVGSDEGNLKSTYVSLCGLEEAGNHLVTLHQQAVDAIKPLGNQAPGLVQMADFVARRKH